MKTTPEHDKKIAKMRFASVYPHYVKKVVSKGRTKEELNQVIKWLTGFDDKKIQELIDENANLQIDINSFFSRCHYSQLSLVL